jgi:MFS family permease
MRRRLGRGAPDVPPAGSPTRRGQADAILLWMRTKLGVLAAVFRNPTLLRLEAAYLIFAFGEWSTWVAVIVYAYGHGGAAEAGVVAFVELVPSVVLAPVTAGLGDRFPRARVLFGSYATQAILMAATAIGLGFGAPALIIYALATVTATAVASSRPLHASLLPEIVGSPDDLTAANVTSGMAESAGSLLGPLGAGLLVGLGGPTAVFAVACLGTLVSAMLVGRLALAGARLAPAGVALAEIDGGLGVDRSLRDRLAEAVGGVTAILADRRLRSVVAIASWATFLVGALDIFYAVLAIDLLGLGDSGVGFLGAVAGVGGVVGAATGVLLVGRERLGGALAMSALLFGGGIAALWIAPGPLAAVVLLGVAGAGGAMTAVAAQTLIQRLAGDDVMSRVFGVLQGLMMGATALGCLAVPILIGLVGERAAFAVAGLSLPVAFLLLGRAILAGDRLDPARADELRRLRSVPMLAPLSAPVLERIASSLVRVEVPGGGVVIREGETGDRFYVVAAGRLDVDVRGHEVRHLGPGDGFGEIALLRGTPRTATVRASGDAVLLAIDSEPFLAALTGQPRSRSIAVGLADQRLAADPGEA